MAGRAKIALTDHILVLALEIALALFLIPRHGLIGAAAARMIGNMTNNLVRLLQVHRYMGLHPYRLDYYKPIVAGLLSVAIARLVVTALGVDSGVPTAAVATVVVGGSYTGLLLLLGLSDEDRNALGALKRKKGAASGQPTFDAPDP